MLFGDTTIFAIECEIEVEYSSWFYGRTAIWIAGRRIGSYSTEVVPMTAGIIYKGLININSEPLHHLSSMKAIDIMFEVKSIFNEEEYNKNVNTSLERQNIYWRYILFAYDIGFEKDILIHHKEVSEVRLIWESDGTDSVYEQLISLNFYKAIIHDYLVWIEQMTKVTFDYSLI